MMQTTRIPTRIATLKQGQFQNNTYAIHKMDDGNIATGVYVLDGQGHEHWQGGRYFTNELDAETFVVGTLARLNGIEKEQVTI